MNITAAGFTFGQGLASSAFGINHAEMTRRRAMHDVMSSAEGAPFQRQLCKIAADLFAEMGDAQCPAAVLFRNLEKTATWHKSYDRFTDHVRRALSGQESLQKEAMGILPVAAALHDKAGGGIMKTLAAGGALGGAALGSLAFLLSRNADQSSAENAILMEKIRAYRKLKNDIEEDMASEPPASMRSKPSTSRYNV
jgi:hypothetical protein